MVSKYFKILRPYSNYTSNKDLFCKFNINNNKAKKYNVLTLV